MTTSTTTVTVQPSPSKVSTILAIIQAALTGLQLVPGVGAAVSVTEVFVSILTNGLAAYQAEVGKPLNLADIPLETPVP